MKRTLIIMLAALLALPTFAQYQLRYNGNRVETIPHNSHKNASYYGLRLGVAAATVSSDDPALNGSSTQAGLNVGVVAGFQLVPSSPIYFETGLFYTEKGGKGTFEGRKFTYDLNYLQLPLVIKYVIDVDGDFTVQPFVGGYLACGVSGKIKDYGDRRSFSSFDEDYFSRFDGGLKIGCGAQYDLIYGELGYDFGLANISHDTFDTAHNGCFYFNVGVNF